MKIDEICVQCERMTFILNQVLFTTNLSTEGPRKIDKCSSVHYGSRQRSSTHLTPSDTYSTQKWGFSGFHSNLRQSILPRSRSKICSSKALHLGRLPNFPFCVGLKDIHGSDMIRPKKAICKANGIYMHVYHVFIIVCLHLS